MSAGLRAKLLRKFAAEECSLVTNARCLTEGVDIKAIDCVGFIDPKQSIVDIVQAAGRAMRQSPKTNKKFGYIIVPLIIKEGECLEEIAQSSSFKAVLKVITSLSTQDERIAEELQETTNKSLRENNEIIQIDDDIKSLIKTDVSNIEKSLRLKIWQNVGKANWLPFEEARDFVHTLKLKNQREWRQYKKLGSLPPNIPRTPYLTYGILAGRLRRLVRHLCIRIKYFGLLKKRAYVRKLELKTHAEWVQYTRLQNITKIFQLTLKQNTKTMVGLV